MKDEDDKPFLIELENFDHANKLRADFGLEPIAKPISHNGTKVAYPLGHGKAKKQDQRALSEANYKVYSQNCLRKIS